MSISSIRLVSRVTGANKCVSRTGILLQVGIFVVLAHSFGSASPALAQRVQLGIDFTTVIPTGEFKENVTNNGYGIGGNFLVRIGPSPVSVGVDAGFTTYGSEEHREPLSPTIPELELKVRTNNNIVLTHALVRVQPRTGNVRPYIDGLIGFKYLFTETSIFDDSGDEELASTNNFSDFAFSYGVGGGVQVRLGSLGRRGDISLDGKVRYLAGGRAEYLKKGSIRRENGNVFFDVLSSRTDVVTVQVGITFRF
jgi:Outer membrane protein beta-barrel domain